MFPRNSELGLCGSRSIPGPIEKMKKRPEVTNGAPRSHKSDQKPRTSTTLYAVYKRSATLKFSVVGKQKGSNRCFCVWRFMFCRARKLNTATKKTSDSDAPFERHTPPRDKPLGGTVGWCHDAICQCRFIVHLEHMEFASMSRDLASDMTWNLRVEAVYFS